VESLSKGLPRGILPSGLLFAPNHVPPCEAIEVSPLNSHELQAFCGGQVKTRPFHAFSFGEG
jgi:hypothetical protein